MSGEKTKINITTLGCSKNDYDSSILSGVLKYGGAIIEEDPENSDVVIINTCGFINPAKEESVEAILEAVELKNKGKIKKVIVFGCMAVRYMEELKKEIPEVDAFFSTEDYLNIARHLKFNIKREPDYFRYRDIELPAHTAYLKIAEGCNHKCSFCAIPLMRGKHVSRSMDNILEEARMLAEKGVKELIIISQDTTYYGYDLYGKSKITELVRELEKIGGIQWLRLHYFYPSTIPDDLPEIMASGKKIVPYIDLPLQHISDNMLKIMKRGGFKQKIRELLALLREKIPQVTLRTTFIVGHPGETERDFKELLDFVEQTRFDRLGVFKYSDEEGTAAFDLSAKVKPEIAEERYNLLMEKQRGISLELNEQKIGKILPVIVDEQISGENLWIGRTKGDSPEIDNEVLIKPATDDHKIRTGDIIEVKITGAEEYELFADYEGNYENKNY